MFILHTSNKAENLLFHLSAVLTSPLSDPFAKETFLIQSAGMERWLCQGLTEHQGLWANFEFFLPNTFFQQFSNGLCLDKSPFFEKDSLIWQLEAEFRQLKGTEFQHLQTYFKGHQSPLKRYQLAKEVAFLFDQYQFMRPDWLIAWQEHRLKTKYPAEQWLSALWRQLDLFNPQHQTPIIGAEMLLKQINQSWSQATVDFLPERLNVFGIHTLSPLYLNLLDEISKKIEVHFYLLNPCQEYWADLTPKAVLDLDGLTLNPLLRDLGQQGRDFQSLLTEHTLFEKDFSSFEEVTEQPNLLQRIQNDILNNQLSEWALNADKSIQIHACHTMMREVEVIKDQLLALLMQYDDLEMRDILVMAPDIQEYAPFVKSVFSDIPFAVSDYSMLDENQVLNLLLDFIRLCQSQMGWQEMLSLLSHPVVYQNFNLIEADLPLITHWVNQTNIRWGADKKHRQESSSISFEENSWQAGLNRLLMGLICADEDFQADILPFIEIEGQQSKVLSGLVQFYQLVQSTRILLSKEYTFSRWKLILDQICQQLFDQKQQNLREMQQLKTLFATFDQIAEIHQQPLSIAVINAFLTEKAESEKTTSGFLRGQMTFCSFLPMRAIPFKVIVVMGMNEGDFPKIDHSSAFDLMGSVSDFKKGDRSRRHDERYQFLEIILSARKHLILSYIGQSIKDNQPQSPSIVISELLDLTKKYQIEDEDLVTIHPLQAFSTQYFEQNTPLFSYSKLACETVKQQQKQRDIKVQPWLNIKNRIITTIPEKYIALDDFIRFFRHPQEWFLNQCLEVRPLTMEKRDDENEAFSVEGLSGYQTYQDMLHVFLDESANRLQEKETYQRILAKGEWSLGMLGWINYQKTNAEIRTFSEQILDLNLGTLEIREEIKLEIENYQLIGHYPQSYQNGNLFYRYAKLKAKDILQAWIIHLLKSKKSYLFAKDQSFTFEPLSPEEAQPILVDLIDIYLQGHRQLSPLLVDLSYLWAKTSFVENKSQTALFVAKNKYSDDYEPSWQLLHRGMELDDIVNDQFESVSMRVFKPIYAHLLVNK